MSVIIGPPQGSGGGSFDPHSPGPIGDVTPGSGAFTTLSATGDAKFYQPTGEYQLFLGFSDGFSAKMGRDGNTGHFVLNLDNAGDNFVVRSDGTISIGAGDDTRLSRLNGGVLAQVNGTNAQSFRVFNTVAGDDFETGIFDWQATPNVLTIGTVAAGAGTLRPLNLIASALQFNGVPVVIPAFDTGWTANADAGDKTASIFAVATVGTVGVALDFLVPNAGALLVQVAQKVKAIETALASVQPLLPNA